MVVKRLSETSLDEKGDILIFLLVPRKKVILLDHCQRHWPSNNIIVSDP